MKQVKRLTLMVAIGAMVAIALSAQTVPQVIQGTELERFLTSAKITNLKDIGTGVTLPQKATLELDGAVRFGVWKTIDEKKSGVTQMSKGIEIEFQDSWRTEVAAYELDKLLNLGMVPATIERAFNGKRGSIQFWVESKMAEADRVKNKISPPNAKEWNEQIGKAQVFDNLIYNTDRHANNMLITEDFRVRLIDHSRSFRPFSDLREPKKLVRFSKSLLQRLQELDEPMLKEKLGKYLTQFQIGAILKRRNAILQLAQKLVKEKGEAAVLYP